MPVSSLAAPNDLPATSARMRRPQFIAAEVSAEQQGKTGVTEQFGPAVTAIVAQAFAQDKEFGPITGRAAGTGRHHQYEQSTAASTNAGKICQLPDIVGADVLSTLDIHSRPSASPGAAFLRDLQFDENEKIKKDNSWFGGAGYNSKKRPDLSNTQMMLEALHQSGLSKMIRYQRALVFVTRCQMNGATNDMNSQRMH